MKDLFFYWTPCKWSSCAYQIEAVSQDFHIPVARANIQSYSLENQGKKTPTTHHVLLHIETQPEYRRKGVGTALLTELLKNCDVCTTGANKKSQEMLLRCGFTQQKPGIFIWTKE